MSRMDLTAMEARIAHLEAMLATTTQMPAPYVPPDPDLSHVVAQAEGMLRLAHEREKLLGQDHLHEPG